MGGEPLIGPLRGKFRGCRSVKPILLYNEEYRPALRASKIASKRTRPRWKPPCSRRTWSTTRCRVRFVVWARHHSITDGSSPLLSESLFHKVHERIIEFQRAACLAASEPTT
jgi:hypothetical protein